MTEQTPIGALSREVKIAAVVPCYRETEHVLDVIRGIGPEVSAIYIVDDACPENTGAFVQANNEDPRVEVIVNERNLGVGGTVLNGYRRAIADGADVIVKIDGDGQMDTALIPELIRPILTGAADYTKGNRLHRRGSAKGMPLVRLFGNMALTLFSKLSSGYWNIMDPTNGFTAIHATVVNELPIDEIAHGYFFESDMLHRLGSIDAVVQDVPMRAKYGAEESHLVVHRIFWPFLIGHIRNSWRRITDTYFVRDFSIASLQLVLGTLFVVLGSAYGAYHWIFGVMHNVYASAGTVVLAALPVIVGVQLLIAFLNYDTRRVPTKAIHDALAKSHTSEN